MKRNHTLALTAILAAALPIVAASNLIRTRASSGVVSSETNDDARRFLSGPVTARAAASGNPWVTLSDGRRAPAEYQGPSRMVQQLKDNQTRSLSIASADFDEDGVPDVVTGHAGSKDGVISIQRGDADAIYPNTREAVLHRAQLRALANQPVASDDIQSPFFASSRAFDTSGAPEFLATGDFDGDGHLDVVSASEGGASIVLLSGDGLGGFAPPRSITLPGKITALASADVNRMDGLADVMVAVKGAGGPKLLIFEGSAGALNASPESIDLPGASRCIAAGQLDDDYPVDIAVAAGSELVIVHGRDRKHSSIEGKKLDAAPPVITRIPVSFSIASMAIGDFTGDLRQEIALLSDDGVCHVFSRAAAKTANWGESSAVATHLAKNQPGAASRSLITVRVSSSPKDDLLVLDQAGRQLLIIINESATISEDAKGPASLNLRVAGAIDFDAEPCAVMGMRLNADALSDLVVLENNASAPTVMVTRPSAVFVVINTDDSGTGSLRQAISSANSSPGADSITFMIPGGGAQTITPLSALPSIAGAVTIDGTTQSPGSAVPPIQLAGNNAGLEATGLNVAASNCTVRGLVINRFDGVGVLLSGSGSIVDGDFIGTNAAGTAGLGNGQTGVLINDGSGHLIGGTVAAARNVISANISHGVEVLFGPATNNLVQGNFIGTDVTGSIGLGNQSDGVEMLSGDGSIMNCTVGGTTAGAGNVISANVGAGVQFITVGTVNLIQGNLIGTDVSGSNDLGNGSSGVAINEANDCTIGGTVAGAGNVISGNGSNGVRINSPTSTGNRVQGNKIGTRADGATALPNTSDGVVILNSASNNTIGGAAGEGNIIAFNFGAGVLVDTGVGNLIQANSIFSNGGLGIDLSPLGVTPNDAGDGDSGANNLQNFPVLTTSNGAVGGSVNIQGSLNSTPNATFTLAFYSSVSCDPLGNGEGKVFLGSASTTTNPAGNATFNITLAGSASVGDSITATATNALGSTSEFSACVLYGAADVGVTKAASAGTIVAGSAVTYTITLVNNGPDSASSITVTDNLPAAVSFVSCFSTGAGVCGGAGNNRSISFNSLAPGASETITIVANLSCSASNGAIVGNTASVTSVVRDPVSGNNSSSINFTISNPPRVLTPTSQAFPADGGDGSVSVTAPSGCGWLATSNDTWITVTSGSLGSGNGSVRYHVGVNSTGNPRSGTITIAGQTFTVNQSNVFCSFSIMPTSNSFPATGGTGSFAVTAGAGCTWKATSQASWITVTPGTENGVGNGTVGYSVDANSSTLPRTGTISIGGQTFTATQAASPCAFSLSPTGAHFGVIGRESSLSVVTTVGCDWAPSTLDSWIIIKSEAAGTGPGVVSYGVKDNFTGLPRSGAIMVAGISFVIVQDGAEPGSCAFAINPSSAVINASGGNGSVQVVTTGQCAWGAASNVSWITLTSDIVGIGSGTVTFSVQANPGAGRAGVITIGGQAFRVKQKGA